MPASNRNDLHDGRARKGSPALLEREQRAGASSLHKARRRARGSQELCCSSCRPAGASNAIPRGSDCLSLFVSAASQCLVLLGESIKMEKLASRVLVS